MNGRLTWVIAGVAALVVSSGCAQRTQLIRNENMVQVDGLMSMWGTWLKDKDDKVDVRINIANDASHGLLIRLRDIHCSRGERWGDVKLLGAPKDAATLHFYPDEKFTFTMVCEFADDPVGDFRVLVGAIFEEPDKAPGVAELIASDVEWSIPHKMID